MLQSASPSWACLPALLRLSTFLSAISSCCCQPALYALVSQLLFACQPVLFLSAIFSCCCQPVVHALVSPLFFACQPAVLFLSEISSCCCQPVLPALVIQLLKQWPSGVIIVFSLGALLLLSCILCCPLPPPPVSLWPWTGIHWSCLWKHALN